MTLTAPTAVLSCAQPLLNPPDAEPSLGSPPGSVCCCQPALAAAGCWGPCLSVERTTLLEVCVCSCSCLGIGEGALNWVPQLAGKLAVTSQEFCMPLVSSALFQKIKRRGQVLWCSG